MSDHLSARLQSAEESRPVDLSFSSEISAAALVNILVRKGVLLPSELIEEERRLRALNEIGEARKYSGHSGSRLKRWAAKRRWSRRLTHFLFGWEFKRVHREKPVDSAQS